MVWYGHRGNTIETSIFRAERRNSGTTDGRRNAIVVQRHQVFDEKFCVRKIRTQRYTSTGKLNKCLMKNRMQLSFLKEMSLFFFFFLDEQCKNLQQDRHVAFYQISD